MQGRGYIIKAEGMENLDQPKPDPKAKAIASFILGIISLVPLLVLLPFILRIIPSYYFQSDEALYPQLRLVLLLAGDGVLTIGPITGLIGLILGVMGLKSTKRNFAIAGIALSIIALLPVIFCALFIIYCLSARNCPAPW